MLKYSDRRVISLLANQRDPVSQQALADRTRYTKRTVRASVGRLERLGLLTVDRTVKPHRYRLTEAGQSEAA